MSIFQCAATVENAQALRDCGYSLRVSTQISTLSPPKLLPYIEFFSGSRQFEYTTHISELVYFITNVEDIYAINLIESQDTQYEYARSIYKSRKDSNDRLHEEFAGVTKNPISIGLCEEE